MSQVLLNNTSTKLAAAVAPSDVTINVTAGDGVKFALATGGNTIRATLVKISGFKEIAWEIVDVTARSTDALTVTRARESTSALSFAIGDLVDVRFTAETNLPGSASANFKVNILNAVGIAIEDITASTLVNSWVNQGGNNSQAGYWKDAFGLVHLTGTIKNGTVPATIFTLPSGYRPVVIANPTVMANNAAGAVAINLDGTVVMVAGSNVIVCLDGITFRTT
jgi:hypothetical protein